VVEGSGDVDPARESAQRGTPDAMRRFGNLLNERGDLAGAEDWYRRAAESGDVGFFWVGNQMTVTCV
jgi:hypothetical protein